jgi:pimeloyl-ACP methyl ester carboxylesterase
METECVQVAEQETHEQAQDPVAAVGVDFDERWLAVQGGAQLRVLEWRPREALDSDSLVFVAGWVSVVEGWLPVLRELVRTRPVIYIETREKRSARIEPKRVRIEEFTLERLAQDLINAADALELDRVRPAWFGSSMGSNAILEALKGDRLPARAAFLVGPNAEFRIPWWGWPVIRLPAWSYHVLKHFVIWYVRHFRVDEKAEPEQMLRYERTLNAADPLRLKMSARAVVDYQVWTELESITAPVAIAFAPTDTLHGEQEVLGIVKKIPRGRAVACESNAYMHDARIVADLDRFLVAVSEAK